MAAYGDERYRSDERDEDEYCVEQELELMFYESVRLRDVGGPAYGAHERICRAHGEVEAEDERENEERLVVRARNIAHIGVYKVYDAVGQDVLDVL